MQKIRPLPAGPQSQGRWPSLLPPPLLRMKEVVVGGERVDETLVSNHGVRAKATLEFDERLREGMR